MIFFQKTAVITAALTLSALSAQADVASLDTPENIAAAMEACVVVTAAHDYDAEGQQVDIAWNRLTDRSASFGAQDAVVNVSANVWSGTSFGNSACDFMFEDETLARGAFDHFMSTKDPMTFEDKLGICASGNFIIVEVTGPEGPIAAPMGKQGHITVHNAPGSTNGPCA